MEPNQSPQEIRRLRVTLCGAVQGVGFRPFVYRLATQIGLKGFVRNGLAGLLVEVEGEAASLISFHSRLIKECPPAAVILAEETAWLDPAGYASFEIVASELEDSLEAAVLPDLATCPDCLREIRDAAERRSNYPFTNCTRCGPRFTIVLDLPYDRPRTTMASFPLCDDCRCEYTDPADRRFHAQPIACPRCGPALSASIDDAVRTLRSGGIVALKGIGGYQLLCDAQNPAAIAELRTRKRRRHKPLAVMMPSLEVARCYCTIPLEEERLLTSTAAPIVLLRPAGEALPESVSAGSPWLGVMLPYSPLHHLLMAQFQGPIIATSGNLSDEPIAIDNAEAHDRLGGIADLFIDHNRPIARPCDDSLARVQLGRELVLRRARGYAPLPVPVRNALPRVLAVGGHLKNTVALALGRQVVVSQHIGDLDTPEARDAFERAIADLCRLYRFTPDVIACDAHPDYYSTHWALSQSKPVVKVQHHRAHAASCAAENDVRGPYLAFSWDGTGYGDDATIWGSEVFLCEGARMERCGHLAPFFLLGGDAGARECWRPAAALLDASNCELPAQAARFKPLIEARKFGVDTTSMGRLFDAVAALCGIAGENRFEGEAAMRLESHAWRAPASTKPYPLPQSGGVADWKPLIAAILEDLSCETPIPEIAAAFHLALAEWIKGAARAHAIRQVVLTGGCFQNAWLTEAAARLLASDGIRVFTHQRVPPNDGGLSLGQAVLAS
jgi:hydrogenase maturation protein HypF